MTIEVVRKSAITKTDEFKKKGLCSHSLDIGILCDHGCKYCSTPAIASARTNLTFKAHGTTPQKELNKHVAYVDLGTPVRVKEEAVELTAADTVMLCTKVDPYSPGVQGLNLLRDSLRNLLEASDRCKVRILSKNADIVEALEEFIPFADRISFSLSITAPPAKSQFAAVVEPNASSIAKRFRALRKAKEMGFRIYGMICPCCPSILTDKKDFKTVLKLLMSLEPDAIWVEPLNRRGASINNTARALEAAGLSKWADAIASVSDSEKHDQYVASFVDMVNEVIRKERLIVPVRMLIYNQINRLVSSDDNVIWLKNYDRSKLHNIHIDELQLSPMSTRCTMSKKRLDELTASILRHGVLQPILFHQDDRGRPVIVSGNRRLVALRTARNLLAARGVSAKALKMYETIPALFVKGKPEEIALVENLHHVPLTQTETAMGIASLGASGNNGRVELVRTVGMHSTRLANTYPAMATKPGRVK